MWSCRAQGIRGRWFRLGIVNSPVTNLCAVRCEPGESHHERPASIQRRTCMRSRGHHCLHSWHGLGARCAPPGCRLPLFQAARRVRDHDHDQPRVFLGLARSAEFAAIAASSPAGSPIASAAQHYLTPLKRIHDRRKPQAINARNLFSSGELPLCSTTARGDVSW
jgi:hypothetical protein